MHRALGHSHISRAPFAPLGSGAHSAPAWVGWLLANFNAGSALLVFCGWVWAAAKHSVLTTSLLKKENKFLKRKFVRPPAYNKLKTSTKAGGKASHEQRFKTKTAGAGVVRARPPLYVRERKNLSLFLTGFVLQYVWLSKGIYT
jgi:hypothetical protein